LLLSIDQIQRSLIPLEKLREGTEREDVLQVRRIDAKSAWTAAHSERVTELARRIGWVLGLSQKELDALYRGGLLHHIGKIGIPPEILDRMGRLTVEESEVMHRHVRIGARILEPAAAYMEVGIPTASRERPSLWGAASLLLRTPLMP
jgi:HD-GYP domain-containing protein (c-di-GMP phosphodiesterase class II)